MRLGCFFKIYNLDILQLHLLFSVYIWSDFFVNSYLFSSFSRSCIRRDSYIKFEFYTNSLIVHCIANLSLLSMAQVRQQQLRHPSPTHARARPLPDPMQFHPSPSNDLQRTQSLRNFEQPSYLRTPVRSIHTQLIINPTAPAPLPPPRLGQIGFYHPSEHAKYDPLTGLMIDASTSATNSNANFDQSYLVSSSFNSRLLYEREQAPPVPPRVTENPYVFPRRRSHFDQARLDRQLLEVGLKTLTPLILMSVIGRRTSRHASIRRRRWSARRFYGE